MAKKTNGYTKGRVRQNISPSTQQIDFGLRAMKRYKNTESRPGCKEHSWEATDGDAEGCNQEGTSAYNGQTPSEGYKDRQQCQGSC